MHLKPKDGKSRSNEEINKSLLQVVFAPSNFTKMKEQIRIFGGLNQIFFGGKAKITKVIWDFYKLVRKNKSVLKHKCNYDNLLLKNVCISMCSKVQQWLAQYEIAQDGSEAKDGIVVFSGILEYIWENRFLVHLTYVTRE